MSKAGDTSFGNTSIFSRFSTRTHFFSPSKFKVTIQLLDDEETLHAEFKKNATGQEILDYVCAYLDIMEKDYFGLRFQDPNKFRYWVDLTKPLAKQFSSSSSLTLRFRFRFYPENPFILKEEITRYQLFVQLRRDLLHGRLHCSQHESATLAALILQSVLGDYNPHEHPPGYVSQYKLLLKQYDRLEDKIAELHQEFKGMVPSEAEAKFLEISSRLDTYGFDPYVVRDAKQNVEVIIGVTCRGILIYLKNIKVHFLHWKDLLKVDYFGKQLRIYPSLAYLENYHQSREHLAIGDSLLNTTMSSDSEDEDPKKKKSKSKKHQFKMTCPSSDYAKHLWKHILSQQVFFTEDQAKFVKPKFSKPRIPLISRGSTFRCPTRRVLHEITEDTAPLREVQPTEFQRYQLPKGLPRIDYQYNNKYGTMPAMHVKSRSTIQPIEEEQLTRTSISPTTTTTISTNNLNVSTVSALANDISELKLNNSTGSALISSPGVKDEIQASFTETDTERLFAELRSSTPIRGAEIHRNRLANGDINLDDNEAIQQNVVVKTGQETLNGNLKTNGQVANGHLPNGSNTAIVSEAGKNSRGHPSIGKQLASWIFGFLLIFTLLIAICVVAFESNSVAKSEWFSSLPYVDELRERLYEPARTTVMTNYQKIVSKF